MRRIIALVFMICFCFEKTASSANAITPIAPTWEQQVGQQALRKITWDWQSALGEWKIRFDPGRPGYHGIADLDVCRITIWVRSTDSPESVAGTIGHEIGHAFDKKYLTSALRGEWLATRELPLRTPWTFPLGPLSTDYLSGAGDFAESVSWVLRGPGAGFRSCLGLRPGDLQKKENKTIARGCKGLQPNETQQALIWRWLIELPRSRSGGK